MRTELADADDHELRRSGHGDSDQDDEAAVVKVVLGHRRTVAADEERLLRPPAHELSCSPERGEHGAGLLAHPRPGRLPRWRARGPGEIAGELGADPRRHRIGCLVHGCERRAR